MEERIRGYNLETGDRWALLIGVSSYPASRGFLPLPHSRSDVEAVARVLRDGPTPYQIRRLADESDPEQQPTLTNIMVGVKHLVQLAGPEDLIVLYFSGHGLATSEGTWLVPLDCHRELPEKTALSVEWLRAELLSSKAAVKLLIIDACHAAPPGKGFIPIDMESFTQNFYLPSAGFAVLAASRHHEVASVWEERGRSVFTHFLAEGLESQVDENGIVTLSSLYGYIHREVRYWTMNKGRAPQTPVLLARMEGEVQLRATLNSRPAAVPRLEPFAQPLRPPYRFLEPFTEADASSFFGREQDTRGLLELTLYNRHVVVTAPSGAGKTSLLRAGLTAALKASGAEVFYVPCREEPIGALIKQIDSAHGALKASEKGWLEQVSSSHEALLSTTSHEDDPVDLARAVTVFGSATRKRVVLILDQLESYLLADTSSHHTGDQLTAALVELENRGHWHLTDTGIDYTVILSLREDFLYLLRDVRRTLRIMSHQEYAVRPLSRAQAGEAITGPLRGRSFSFAPDLLERMLDDLEKAGRAFRQAHGQTVESGIFPPHLQILCTALYTPGAEQLVMLEHYEKRGGLDGFFADHLESVLDKELTSSQAKVARDLLKALVNMDGTRRTVPEQDLKEALRHRHHPGPVIDQVILLLEEKRLVTAVSVRDTHCYELTHDFLADRFKTWIDVGEGERRAAINQFRMFIDRRSQGDFERLELKEARRILRYPDILDELLSAADPEKEQAVRAAWEAVDESRRHKERLRVLVGSFLALLTIVLGVVLLRWQADHALAASNRGNFQLELTLFDLDKQGVPQPVAAAGLPHLSWTLYDMDSANPTWEKSPTNTDLISTTLISGGNTQKPQRIETVEAPGGPHFLKISGRGRDGQECGPAWIRIQWSPGYSERAEKPGTLRVAVPTCQASAAGMVEIPDGEFYHAGPGEPPSTEQTMLEPERIQRLPTYYIDTTEVTNRAYKVFARNVDVTGRALPVYQRREVLPGIDQPDHPVGNINWFEARDFCRFMGKELPSRFEWEKAVRGGIFLDRDGRLNPFPRRNSPWEPAPFGGQARLAGQGEWQGSAPVRAFRGDQSPYRVFDLAGNVREWLWDDAAEADLSSHTTNRTLKRLAGGGWGDDLSLGSYSLLWENTRDPQAIAMDTGVRCVSRRSPVEDASMAVERRQND